MADFGGMVLTTRGLNLLAKAQTGAELVITRVAAGAGVWPADTNAEAVTALVDERLTVPIQSMTVPGDGTVKLTVVISNSGLAAGFIFRELGVFAHDPDLGEILYAVAYAGERYDYLPAAATVVEKILDIYIVVGGAQNVTATISPGAVLALKDDIDAHIAADPAHPASNISFDNSKAKFVLTKERVQHALDVLAAGYKRELTSNLQLYVATTGSDTNDGLTAGTPFRTIDHAIAIISSRYSLGDFNVTINVAAGTYNESVKLRPLTAGLGAVFVFGAGSAQTIIKRTESIPGAVAIAIYSSTGAGTYVFKNLAIAVPEVLSSIGSAISISSGKLTLDSVSITSNVSSTESVVSVSNATLEFKSACAITVLQGCLSFVRALSGALVAIDSNLVLSGSVTAAAVLSSPMGVLYRNPVLLPIVSGAVTGRRYYVGSNGIISTAGGGVNYFPGTVAGSTDTGGQYS